MRFVFVALFLVSYAAFGEEEVPSLASLGDKVSWEKLPPELTQRAFPLNPLRLEVGKTDDDQEYLRIEPADDPLLKFAVVPVDPDSAKYQVESERAIYWPGLRLLAFEKEVVVSASGTLLEGKGFDLLLAHDTVRLVEPKLVSIQKILIPVESESVRIGGLGGKEPPLLKWKDGPEQPAEPSVTEQPTEAPAEAEPEPTRPPLPSTPSVPEKKQYDVFVHPGGKIEFEGSDSDLRGLRDKVEALGQKEPDAVFTLHQAPSVDSALVREIHHVLEEAGYKQIKTVVERPEMESTQLAPESEEVLDAEEISVPTHPGARLLWMDGPGKFYLNGKPFTEPSLRQMLRTLVRTTKEIPIVIAAAKRAPITSLKALAEEVVAFGFDDVRVALPEAE